MIKLLKAKPGQFFKFKSWPTLILSYDQSVDFPVCFTCHFLRKNRTKSHKNFAKIFSCLYKKAVASYGKIALEVRQTSITL